MRFISLQIAIVLLFLCVPIRAQTNSTTIITNFADKATLTADQVQTALKLATKAGLKDIGEIRTIHCIPAGGIVISVCSHERIDRRRITSEEVAEYCTGLSGFLVLSNALRLKDFWINPPYIYTNYQLEVTISGTKQRIGIEKSITTETADKIIQGFGLALSERLSQKNEYVVLGEQRPDISQLSFLRLDYYDVVGGFDVYELSLSYADGWRGYNIKCKFDKGKLVILSVSYFVV